MFIHCALGPGGAGSPQGGCCAPGSVGSWLGKEGLTWLSSLGSFRLRGWCWGLHFHWIDSEVFCRTDSYTKGTDPPSQGCFFSALLSLGP